MRKSILLLLLVLAFDVWYRAHTFGPTIAGATGANLWPRTTGPSEPLDCDEAIYAHMGRRIFRRHRSLRPARSAAAAAPTRRGPS